MLKARRILEKMSFKKSLMMIVSIRELLFSKRDGLLEGLSKECRLGRLKISKVRNKNSWKKRAKMKVVCIS